MKITNILVAAASLLLAASAALAAPAQQSGADSAQKLTREVRHELVMLPYFGVFDNLEFKVNGTTVVLIGQVTRPTLKTDAERAVKRIESVEKVDNQIEVLPVSPGDDRIRLATYRAIYGNEALSTYAVRAVPPIHIIVKNGNVTLVGAVGNEMDKNLAYMQARGVPGVFSVTNSLVVDKK
jgi:hyperosmotically inducible protein